MLILYEKNETEKDEFKRDVIYRERNELLKKMCQEYKMTNGTIKNEIWSDFLFHPQYQVRMKKQESRVSSPKMQKDTSKSHAWQYSAVSLHELTPGGTSLYEECTAMPGNNL